ncbi:MAG TPA: cytochrome c biogenesis protein CcdA [Bacillota bacterium]|nr:cytochrome c biogenesis protein CcdA [Bacillota bacterium]
MITQWLETLSALIAERFWLAPMLAFLAGILTSVTPCALSSVPLVIGYVGGFGNNDLKKAFRLSLTFALGMALTFTVLGTVASMLGRLIGTSGKWWYLVLGVLMLLMALQTWEIYNFIPSTYLISKSTKKGYIGAFLAGILGGVFSSPCATPVLVVLLGIVARSGNVAWGVLLLLLYSLGHSFLVLLAGTSIGFVKKITASEKYGFFSKVLKYTMGTVILFIAFYMFYLGF